MRRVLESCARHKSLFASFSSEKEAVMFHEKKNQKTYKLWAPLAAGLWVALTSCAVPPPGAYSSGAGDRSAAVALGNNAAGEACSQTEVEPKRSYAIYCGTWKQPSAELQAGGEVKGTPLATLATDSEWRRRIDSFLSCAAPEATTIQGGQAELLRCTRRQEGFPQTAFVAAIDGRVWYADGVPAASPVMERALALNAGRIAPGSLGLVQESPGLAAERLATRAVSANDLSAYDSLRRTAVRANLAGDFAAAEIAYRSMVTLQQKALPPGDPALAKPMALEALQMSNQGRYPEATALLARAEALARRGDDGSGALAAVWHYQGLNLLNQNKPREAIALLRRAETAYLPLAPDTSLRDASGDGLIPPDLRTQEAAFGVMETRRAQAIAYRLLGDTRQSQAEADDAARVLAAYGLSNLKAAARISRTEATVLLAAGKDAEALSKMRAAVMDFARALPGSRAYAETQLLLAARLAESGDTAQAQATCRQAGHVLRGAGTGVDAAALQPCLALLAKAAEAGDQDAAREMFLLAGQAQGNTTSQQIALVSARLAENARDPKAAKLIRERDDANAALASLYAAGEDAAATGDSAKNAALRKQIEAAEKLRDSLDQALQSASPNYGQLIQQAVSADDILAALRPHEAFSAIVLAPSTGYNFVLADGKIAVGEIAGGAGRVDRLVARIRASIDDQGSGLKPFDTAASAELYAALFGKAAPVLAQASSLTVAPSGTLLSIPFGLLLTGPADPARLADAPWLIRRLVIAHVPAPANFVTLRRVAATSRADKPWFGFGDFRPVTLAQAAATFPPATCKDSAALFAGLPPLPGADAELAEARSVLGATPQDTLLGPAFTAAAVQALPLKGYRMLHFATHAILQTDLACQAEPALVTSAPRGAPDAQGAMLTASEIAGLKLDADVVLLSACNSGGPGGSAPGESLSGMARSFFYAGARSLLVTHWDVNDKVTAILVGAALAYAKADPGLGMEGALAAAQRRLLDKARDGLPELAHPFYWAPLALIGEGRAGTALGVTRS
jgi:CHAT domain-containing protein